MNMLSAERGGRSMRARAKRRELRRPTVGEQHARHAASSAATAAAAAAADDAADDDEDDEDEDGPPSRSARAMIAHVPQSSAPAR